MSMLPIDLRPPLDGRRAAAAAAAVAAALAELHGRGLLHGALRPDLVLLDEVGTVSLLPADEPVPAGASPADDVAALGEFLAWLAERVPDRGPHRQHRRLLPHRPPGLLRPPHPADVLADLAGRCRSRDPADRPSARLVAATLHRRLAAPSATPATTRGQARSLGRRRAVLGSVVAVSILGVAAAPAQCAPSSAVAPEPRADAMSVRWNDGVLAIGTRRYAVGAAGDHVLVDRWGCGAQAVALLRRPSGEVVGFEHLPEHGEHTVGRVLARLPGATRLVARPTTEGCPVLAVATAEGRTVPVPWRAAS